MAKPPPPTHQKYDEIVQAYRLLGSPMHRRAAIVAGTVPEVTKHAWEHGWQFDGEGYMPPIREEFAREALEARVKRSKVQAALLEARQIDLTAEQDDQALQRALEGLAARAGVIASERLLSTFVKTTTEANEVLGPRFLQEVRRIAQDPDTKLGQIQAVFAKLAKTLKESVEALEKAQQAERRALGEADVKVAITHTTTPVEAVRDLFSSFKALQSAAQAKLPKPVDAVVLEAKDSAQPALSLADELGLE